MDLVDKWKGKHSAGQIRFDPDPLIVRSMSASAEFEWGTVFYSSARETYKSEVLGDRTTSFDLELMSSLHLADEGGLVIAANPNSLFEGHLVIYPRVRSRELTPVDLRDMTELAAKQPQLTFIHNAENSAASVVDWAHFQAYAMTFPLAGANVTVLAESNGLTISRVSEDFPAYAIRIESDDPAGVADLLFRISQLLLLTSNPQGARIPVNYIWMGNQVWVVPRASGQSRRAAMYFGGLEMGGLFCLPSSNEFAAYLPNVLIEQVEQATLRTPAEDETRVWFEAKIKDL